jgi:L-lactate dehydrogenase complex protein LldG
MDNQGSRSKILNKIKQALKKPVAVPFPDQVADTPIFIPTEQELAIGFAEKFTELLGKFVYCTDEAELVKQLNNLIRTKGWTKVYSKEEGWLDDMKEYHFDPVNTDDLATCDVAITLCEHLIARTGSIVLSAHQHSGRTTSVYAPIHICVAYTHQLLYDVTDSLTQFKNEADHLPSMISYATGPSRTADIEKTLVVGVHGPKEVYCFLVDKLLDS